MNDSNPLDIYWSQPIDRLMRILRSSPEGLSTADARQRLRQFGPNLLKPKRQMTGLRLLLSQFRSPLVLILIFAAVVSAVVHEWVDATVILVIVLGSALLSFAQEYRATNAVEKLRARVTIKATVVRDGHPRSIPAAAVVPGDVVLLAAGSLIAGDGVLLEAKDCGSLRIAVEPPRCSGCRIDALERKWGCVGSHIRR